MGHFHNHLHKDFPQINICTLLAHNPYLDHNYQLKNLSLIVSFTQYDLKRIRQIQYLIIIIIIIILIIMGGFHVIDIEDWFWNSPYKLQGLGRISRINS